MTAAPDILVVDDSPPQADRLRLLLEGNGYRVRVAGDGEQALDRLGERAPAAVVSDVLMPGMDGFELCRRIKAEERWREIPVLLLTALEGTQHVLKGLACGADSFITTPCSDDYLLRTLHDVLANRQPGRKPREPVTAEVMLGGKLRAIQVNPQQMLTLLLSTYESMVTKNAELSRAQEELRQLNERLESSIAKRTAVLAYEIAERRRAEKTLRESSAYNRRLIEVSLDPLVTIGPDGKITDVNTATETVTGRSRTELIGTDFSDYFTEPEKARAVYQQVFSEGLVRDYPLELRHRDGPVSSVLYNASVYRDEAGRVVGVFAAARDVAERRRAEHELQAAHRAALNMMEDAIAARDLIARKQEELQASEEHHRSITESAMDAIITADAAGRIVDWNPAAGRMFGYGKDEVRGEPLTLIVPPRYRDEHCAGLARLQAGGAPHVIGQTVELAGLHRDGHEFPLELSLSKWTTAGGIFFSANIHDITNRKRAREELQQSEERYRLFFESNPLAMWLCDPETFRFLAVNDAAVQHYGYTREEFLGMTIKQIRPPEDIPNLLKSLADGPAEAIRTGEFRHRRKDGTILHVEVISRALVFGGRPARLVLANDITEKKLLEARFLHAQRLESIGMLASGIAHDLNNVLAPIVFAAPLLRANLTAPRDLKILDTLERSAARGTGLVQQILGFAHTAAGEFRPTQVKHLTRDIIGVIEETFPKTIQFEHRIPSDLWLVLGNPTQIHQVLLNLCVNSRDAMPAGGTLRLTAANRRLEAAECGAIAGARPGDWLMLEVTDTGTGIAPEVLAHIWEPFFTTKSTGKGTGLGLATVRGIVASHHGFVELQTEVGHGSAFRVYLPAIVNEPARMDSASPLAIPDGHGELILVVDDEAPIRDLATEILGQHGYHVVTCADGLEAIDVFGTRPSDISLVLTDVDMPRLGGVALARALLQARPDLRLIAMSGLSRHQTGGVDLPEIRQLCHAFLTKPFKPEELLGTIHGLLHPSTKT